MIKKAAISHADIAKLVNVTQSTVSRALDPERCNLVSAKTRQKVEQAAQELGFCANIHARRVRTRCSESITVVIDNLNSLARFFNDFNMFNQRLTFENLNGIVDGAAEAGFEVKLLPLHSKKEINTEFLTRHLEFPYSDGVIFLGYYYMRNFYDVIRNCRTPHLIISGAKVPGAPMPAFLPDPEPGIELAARALLEKGHRNFCYHAFKLDTEPVYQRERFDIWQTTLKRLNPACTIQVVEAADHQTVHHLAKQYVAKCDFTAMIAANDGAGELWRRELNHFGVKVPEEIAVIGYDGNEIFHELSSVAVPYYEIGKAAALAVIEAAQKGESTVEGRMLPTTFKQGTTI